MKCLCQVAFIGVLSSTLVYADEEYMPTREEFLIFQERVQSSLFIQVTGSPEDHEKILAVAGVLRSLELSVKDQRLAQNAARVQGDSDQYNVQICPMFNKTRIPNVDTNELIDKMNQARSNVRIAQAARYNSLRKSMSDDGFEILDAAVQERLRKSSRLDENNETLLLLGGNVGKWMVKRRCIEGTSEAKNSIVEISGEGDKK